jgi:hypothetical protein
MGPRTPLPPIRIHPLAIRITTKYAGAQPAAPQVRTIDPIHLSPRFCRGGARPARPPRLATIFPSPPVPAIAPQIAGFKLNPTQPKSRTPPSHAIIGGGASARPRPATQSQSCTRAASLRPKSTRSTRSIKSNLKIALDEKLYPWYYTRQVIKRPVAVTLVRLTHPRNPNNSNDLRTPKNGSLQPSVNKHLAHSLKNNPGLYPLRPISEPEITAAH